MKKDNSALIGVTIGILLFICMTPALFMVYQNPSSYEMPSLDMDCNHNHEYQAESVNTSSPQPTNNQKPQNGRDAMVDIMATKYMLNQVGMGSMLPF